jgi:HK97 family phage prohead protease
MIQRLSVPLEIKSLKSREFEGYGSTFGNVDHGGDVVTEGAFTKSLNKHKSDGTLPQMFWMHDPSLVPGMWTEMSEDSKGLYVKGILADTQLGNEIRTLMGMKAVRGLSIGYQVTESDFSKDGTRLLKEIDLWEVSPVSLAMNPLATITQSKTRLSADGEYVQTKREFERFLRDAGYSRKVAAVMVAKIYGDGTSGMLDEHLEETSSEVDPAAIHAAEELAAKFIMGSCKF